MTDFSKDFKKSAAKSFIESKYSPARFCVTFSNRQIDPILLVEWVKDLAISVQENADYWQNQANNQAVIIDLLDAEKEALNLKVCQLAEQNAKLASDGIKVTNKLADMSEENRQLKAENARLANENYILQQEKEVLKRSLSNRFNEYKKLEEDYKMMHERHKTTYSDLHEEQIQNQSLMSEIEELKAMAGHRDNMQFIAICEKIVQDAEELQKHLEGGK